MASKLLRGALNFKLFFILFFYFFQTESIILLIMAESESEGYGSIPNKEGTFGKEVAREKIHQGVYNLITICLHMA